MKFKSFPYFAVILGVILPGCSSPEPESATRLGDHPPITLGQAVYDFHHDGHFSTLSFIWVEGKHLHIGDEDDWCGEGDKYTGRFIFRIELNGSVVDTALDTLYPPGEAFDFIFSNDGQPWKIEMADYNNDGQPDFNIVTYGSCSYSSCWLFTVLPSGAVEALKIEGSNDLTINKPEPGTSTDNFGGSVYELTPTGFCYDLFSHQDNTENINFLDWDLKNKIFHLREEKIALRR